MGRPNLRLRQQVWRVRREGRIFRGRWLHVRLGVSDLDQTLIAVRRRFGKAVCRNRVRRRIRALCRELVPGGHPGQLLLISVGDRSGGASFQDLQSDLVAAFDGLGLT